MVLCAIMMFYRQVRIVPKFTLVLALVLIMGMQGALAQHPALEQRLQDVCNILGGEQPKYDTVFTEAFLKQVPALRLKMGLSPLIAKHGACSSISLVSANNDFSGKAEARSDSGFVYPVTLMIESNAPYRISMLFVGAPFKAATSMDDIVKSLEELDGSTSLCVRELGRSQIIAAKDTNRYLPIGSSFKLYVLGALVNEILNDRMLWRDVVELNENWKSLPSGVIQSWPNGAPVTLHTLAAQMISISDNTATDHLIHHLGRGSVEQIQSEMGHTKPELNRPFLTTRDMFTLKFTRDGKPAEVYAGSSEEQRRDMLRTMTASVPLESIQFVEEPVLPDKVEWFATTADLCRAMDWLRKRSKESSARPLLGVLGINNGVDVNTKTWKTVGYKGGSEAGVLNMTYLMERNDGRWFALSASWLNTTSAVDLAAFAGIVKSAIQVLEAE